MSDNNEIVELVKDLIVNTYIQAQNKKIAELEQKIGSIPLANDVKLALKDNIDKALDLIEANKEKIEQLEQKLNKCILDTSENKQNIDDWELRDEGQEVLGKIVELRQLIKSEVDDMDSAEKHDVNMITRSIEELKEQLWQVRDELSMDYKVNFFSKYYQFKRTIEEVLREILIWFSKPEVYANEEEMNIANKERFGNLLKKLSGEKRDSLKVALQGVGKHPIEKTGVGSSNLPHDSKPEEPYKCDSLGHVGECKYCRKTITKIIEEVKKRYVSDD